MPSLAALATSVASALSYPTELYAVLAVVGVFAVSVLITWGVMRSLFLTQAAAFEPYEIVMFAQLTLVASNIGNFALQATRGAKDTFFSILDLSKSTFGTFLPVFLLAGVSLAYLETQPQIAEAYLWLRQCTVMPALEGLALPLLNLARLLYDVAWPLVNIGTELAHYFTRGQVTILFSCTSYADLRDILTALKDAITNFAVALTTWITTGVQTGRIDTIPALLALGNMFNLLLEPLGCFCSYLNPLWAALTAIPQLTSFQTSVDCAVNVPVRLLQALINFFGFGFQPFDLGPFTIELNCAIAALGDTAQDVVLAAFDMLYDFLLLITALTTPTTSIAPTAFSNGSIGSASLVANRMVPVTLSNAVHSVLRTSASPVVFAADFWVGLPAPNFLNSTLGFESLLLLLTAPWSHIVTEPIAGVISIVNMTVAVTMHITCQSTCDCLIDSPLGLRFLQLGPVADRLRASVDALAQLLAVFTWQQLPAVVSILGQAAVTFVEAIIEFVFGWIYAIAFPTWMPGDAPPDTHCNTCSPAACPGDQSNVPMTWNSAVNGTWTIFSFWPAYYDWNTSALARSRQLLLDDADALAVAFGCNLTTTTGDPNVDDCGSFPGQCFLRRLYQFAVEALRLVEQFILYVPDLVFFDAAHKRTAIDLDPSVLVLRWNQTIDCLTSWLDQLDPEGQNCLTTTAPFGGFDPNLFANATLPDPNPITAMPLNTSLICRNDSLYYYPDGRLFILHPTAQSNATPVYCDPLATNNGCFAAYGSRNGTDYVLTVMGSPPVQNVLLTVSPVADGSIEPHDILVQTSNGYNTITTPPMNWVDYHIVDIETRNCTNTDPPHIGTEQLFDPVPPGMGCAANNVVYYRAPETPTHVLEALGAVYRCKNTGGVSTTPYGTVTGCATLVQENACSFQLPDEIVANYSKCKDPSSLPPVTTNDFQYDMAQYGGPRRVMYRDPTTHNEGPSVCADNNYLSAKWWPKFSICRYNAWAHVDVTPSVANLTAPLYLEGFPASRIPCNFTIASLPTFFCSNGAAIVDFGLGYETFWVYQRNANASNVTYIPCQTNIGTQLHDPAPPPLCTWTQITYANPKYPSPDAANPYLYTTIQVDGTNVRVRFNQTSAAVATPPHNWTFDQTLLCAQAYSATAAAMGQMDATTATAERFWASYTTGANDLFNAQQQRVGATIFKPDVMLGQYRNESLVCALSDAVNCAGDFVGAIALEVLLTVQTLLQLAATLASGTPSTFAVPTFADARDRLRCALCKLATAATRVLPIDFGCQSLAGQIQCGSSAECAQGFLCRAVDVLLLPADILVEVLTTLRSIVTDGTHSPSSPLTDSSECTSFDQAPTCVANMIVYIILRVIHTFLQVVRAVASNVDCFLCVITKAVDDSASCQSFVYFWVDGLATLVDGIANDILNTLVKLGIYVVKFLIDLFSGDSGGAIGSDIVNIFSTIGDLFVHFATTLFDVIWGILMQIPIIKDILDFIKTVYDGACGILEDALNAVSGGNAPDLHCGKKKKRSVDSVGDGSFPPLPTLAAVWASDAPACATRMQTYFNTSAFDYTGTPSTSDMNEFFYCMSAAYWINNDTLDILTTGCETLLPALYHSGTPWPSLPADQRAQALDCIMPRMLAERARSNGNAWVPRDIFYNSIVRTPLLADDLFYGFRVYQQYASDRVTPTELVVTDAAYAANWQLSGFDTSHLNALLTATSYAPDRNAGAAMAIASDNSTVPLPPAPTLVNLTLADALLASDDRATGLALDQYAARALLTGSSTSWRRRDFDTVNGTAFFWRNMLGSGVGGGDSTNATNNNSSSTSVMGLAVSIVSNVTVAWMRRLAAQRVLRAPTRSTLTISSFAQSSPRSRAQLRRTLLSSILIDTVTLTTRVLVNASDLALVSRTNDAVWSLARGAIAGTQLLRQWLGGQARDTAATLDARVLQLQGHPEASNTTTPWVFSAVNSLGNLVSSMTAGVATMAARGQVGTLVGALMTASPTAQRRRTALAHLSAYVQQLSLDFWQRARFTNSMRSAGARNATIATTTTWGSITAVDCLVGIPELCTNCLWLANWFGTIDKAALLAIGYWAGPSSQEPSLAHSVQQYDAYNTYLTTLSATVIVGDSPDLPVRWPSPLYPPLRWFGDPTPNKLRFNDLGALWDVLYNSVAGTVGTTVDVSSAAAAAMARGHNMSLLRHASLSDGAAMDGTLAHVYLDFLPYPNPNVSAVATAAIAAPDVNASLSGWLAFVYDSVRVCDFGAELDGSHKRFSIGEAVLITGTVGLVVSFVVLLPLLGNAVTAFVAALGVSVVTVVFFTLFFAYTYSMRCAPAFPFQLADDLMYFLAYEVFSRCDWLLAGGYVNEATYTNDNCYACALYTADTFTAASCKYDLGFKDFGYYLAFWATQYWPAAVTWLQTTTVPVLADLRTFDAVNTRLHAFDAYDPTDLVQYSQHARCANGETALASFCIALAFALLISLLRPLIAYLLSVLEAMLWTAFSVALLTGTTFIALLSVPSAIAAARSASTPASTGGGGSRSAGLTSLSQVLGYPARYVQRRWRQRQRARDARQEQELVTMRAPLLGRV